MARPIGILGGTFDPVHHGHLRLALEVQELLPLQEVRLIPVNHPPHRQAPVANATHRLAMLEQAIAGTDGLVIDARELQREGTSYTLDTVTDLRTEKGDQPLCLIMGMDAFQSLHTWYQWQKILNFVHIIIVDRPGSETNILQPEVAALYADRNTNKMADINQHPAGSILKSRLPMLDISSTRVRELLSAKQNTRYLIPDNVMHYINQHKLYQQPL